MKQLSSRILATVLSLTLLASAIVGAMSVSVLYSKAATPSSDGYLDDILSDIREFVPSGSLNEFDNVCSQLHDNFDNWLIVIEHYADTNKWYVASYRLADSSNFKFWAFLNTSFTWFAPLTQSNSVINYYSCYGFRLTSSNIYFEPTNTLVTSNSINGYDIFNDNVSGWRWNVPDPDDVDATHRLCWSNFDLYRRSADYGSTYLKFLDSNLVNGSFTPPIIDFHWFKFQLGQRWYVTTYDQSLVANLETGDDTFWVWTMYAFKLSDPDNPEYMFIWWQDVQYLSFAETFISQNLTNVSSSGVLAYDITDLILDPDYVFLSIADFYQVIDTPGGMVLGNLMAESSDQVELNLTSSEENLSNDQAWTFINNYFTNYPSVTVAPKELASQFAGQTAYTGGIGTVQIPQQLQEYKTGSTLTDLDSEFHYDLSASGLQPSEMSYLNFDLFNVVIVPARNSDVVDAAAFNLRYWDYNVPVVNGCIDSYQIGHFHYTNDLFESFDLILIVDADSWWLQDTSTPYTVGPYTHLMYGYTGDISPDDGLIEEFGLFPCYWVLTRSAIQKSQLYVFCDGFDKLYDLATQYCYKRDLWDSSFFDWSMSIFWELQSLDGHLNSIDFTIKSWDLGNKLSDIVDSLNRIADNTDELQEPMWYESLWNWVRQFTPSDSAFLTGLNAIDDGFDNIPLLPVPTNYPTYPLLPTFTPTPVPDPGGE